MFYLLYALNNAFCNDPLKLPILNKSSQDGDGGARVKINFTVWNCEELRVALNMAEKR